MSFPWGNFVGGKGNSATSKFDKNNKDVRTMHYSQPVNIVEKKQRTGTVRPNLKDSIISKVEKINQYHQMTKSEVK